MNELLLAQYLLRTNSDRRFRRWVLSSLIGNTYYHNFVTHLREAGTQREVYRIIDGGGSVNAETLSGLFRRNLELFWGDAVRINEGARSSPGCASRTTTAGSTPTPTAPDSRSPPRSRAGSNERASARWRTGERVLSAGSTLDPAGLAALAGVDITTDRALLDTIDTPSAGSSTRSAP
jgi:oligoendopeptidase F